MKKQTKPGTLLKMPKCKTKQALIIALLKRKKGVTLPELIAVTKWKRHSVRAHIANLRKKKGLNIQTSFSNKVTCYCLIDAVS